MAKAGSIFLDVDNPFPKLGLQLLSGEILNLPEGFGEGYGIMLFYRGYWWPYCRQQLADFQAALTAYHAEQIKVIAGSVDSVEKTIELSDRLGITYPIAYGLDAETVSRLTGGFYEKEKKYLQPTGIIVRPDKNVEMAVYSTGAVGRFVAQDVLSAVKYYKSQLKQWVSRIWAYDCSVNPLKLRGDQILTVLAYSNHTPKVIVHRFSFKYK